LLGQYSELVSVGREGCRGSLGLLRSLCRKLRRSAEKRPGGAPLDPGEIEVYLNRFTLRIWRLVRLQRRN
jgi:hypothetical protein